MSILPSFFAEAANPAGVLQDTPKPAALKTEAAAQEAQSATAESANENLFVLSDKNMSSASWRRMAASGYHDGVVPGLFSQFSEAAKDDKKEKDEKRKENDRLYIFLQTQAQRLAEIAEKIEKNNERIKKINDELDRLIKLKDAIKKQYEHDGYVRLDNGQIEELKSYDVDVESVLQGDIEGGFKPAWQSRQEEKRELEEDNKNLRHQAEEEIQQFKHHADENRLDK